MNYIIAEDKAIPDLSGHGVGNRISSNGSIGNGGYRPLGNHL